MSNRARRAHPYEIRRRNEPAPSGTVKVTIRGDFRKLRRQMAQMYQAMLESAAAAQRTAAQFALFKLRRDQALDPLLRMINPNAGDLHVWTQTVITPTGTECRLIAKRLGGWQRMRVPTNERNP